MSGPLNQTALELSALQQMAEMLASSIGLEELLGRCIDLTLQVAHAPAGTLYLYDPHREQFRRVAVRNVPEEIAPIALPSDSLTYAPSGPWMLDIATLAPQGHPIILAAQKHGFEQVLLLPLRRHDKAVGFFGIHFFVASQIAESTMHTMEAIAGYEAIAIECAQARRQLELRAELASALREFGERANQVESEPELRALILKTALQISRSDGALLCQKSDDTLRVIATAGHTAPSVGDTLPLSAPSADDSTTPVVIEDTARAIAENRAMGPLELLLRTKGAAALLALRLDGPGQWRGHLIATSSAPREYESEEIEAFRILGSMLAQHLERTSAHREILRQKMEFDQIIEQLPILVTIVDPDGKLVHANAAAREFKTIMNGKPMNVLWPERAESHRYFHTDGSPFPSDELPIARAFRGEHPDPTEMIISTADGSRSFTVLALASPLPMLGAESQPAAARFRVVCAMQDVTKLRELANAKERFLSIAAHELRSPIANLSATSSMVEVDPTQLEDPKRRGELFNRIRRQVGRLQKLVDELLQSARSGSAQLSLNLEPVDVKQLCLEMINQCRSSAGSIEFEFSADPESLCGHYDLDRIGQVITNLLNNAVRYSPSGGAIQVRLRRSGGNVRLEIEDHGIGVPTDCLGRLFMPFFRAPNAIANNQAGLGLGLYITAQIVGHHGGTVSVHSLEGSGSTFTIELPLLESAPAGSR